MSEYQPTPKQEQAIREWLQEAIMPLIEQVLVKKLGQAMSFAAGELIQPKREWVGLTDEEVRQMCGSVPVIREAVREAEAKLREKNA